MMLGALIVGTAWAIFNYTSTGGERGEDQLRPLVWTIFSTPFVLFIGWVLARRAEVWLAAFTCFCLYFFTPFVAARIESLVYTAEQARFNGHELYFTMVIVLHGVVGLLVVGWRALRVTSEHNGPPPAPASQHTADDTPPPDRTPKPE
jgi:hypothetical protein